MWLYWTKREDEYYPAYRGYYPLREDIPPSALKSKIKLLRFFARNSVRGRYQVDFLARDLTENVGEKIFKKEWDITQRQLKHLKDICQVPEEQIYVLEGRYSWNSKHSGCNNCASWALNVIHKVVRCADFMEYSSPKQLNVVKKEIAWDFIPE